MNNSSSCNFKFVFLGGTNVGKTSIVQYISTGKSMINTLPTMQAECTQISVTIKRKSYSAVIWDTAGQEAYHSLAEIYYRNADVAFVVVDSLNPLSDKEALEWIEELRNHVGLKVSVVLMMNKLDKVTNEDDVIERAKRISSEANCPYFLTSAITGQSIAAAVQAGFNQAITQFPSMTQNHTVNIEKPSNKQCC